MTETSTSWTRWRPAAVRPSALWTLGGLAVLVLLSATIPTFFGSYSIDRAVALMLATLIAVIGLYLFIGTSGVASFGHVGFMLIGAYVTAIGRMPAGSKSFLMPSAPGVTWPAPVSPVIGALAAGVVAFVLGLVLMRLNGLAAGLATFAFLSIVYVVATQWSGMTGGVAGVYGIPQTSLPATCLPWALGALVIAWLFSQTRTCLQLSASREDEVAARGVGVGVFWQRTCAFTISAAFCGASGALIAQYLGSYNPDAFYLQLTLFTLAMLVVGGSTSLSGAVVGTVLLSALGQALITAGNGFTFAGLRIPSISGLQEMGTAAALLVALLVRPSGLTGGREIGPWLRRRVRRNRPVMPVQSPDPNAAKPMAIASDRSVP